VPPTPHASPNLNPNPDWRLQSSVGKLTQSLAKCDEKIEEMKTDAPAKNADALASLKEEFKLMQGEAEAKKAAEDEAGLSYVEQEEMASRIDELEIALSRFEKKGGQDADGGLKEGLTALEAQVGKMTERLTKTNEIADHGFSLATSMKKTLDAERSQKVGTLEEEVDSLRFKVGEIYSGHHTLSQSVHRLQRSTSDILEKNSAESTGEQLSKISGKLALLWKSKADKDEVDRAITRAVEAVMRTIPPPPGPQDGTFIGKKSLQCLSCDRSVTKVGVGDPNPAPNAMELTQRIRSPELLFGGALSKSERRTEYSGLEIAPQTERVFPYSGLKQNKANKERDLVGDLGARGHTMPRHKNGTPRQLRLQAQRGPGGFKPPPSAGEGRRNDDLLPILDAPSQNYGFKGRARTKEQAHAMMENSPHYNTQPLIPAPPSSKTSSGKAVGAWDNSHAATSGDVSTAPIDLSG